MSRKELATLVESWRKVLLPEWRVIVHDKALDDMDLDGEEEPWAICRTPNNYLKIEVHFTDKLLETQSAFEIEVTVVHELVHALTRPWRNQTDDVAFELGNAKAAPLRERQKHEEEKLVDRLAYVLVAQAHGGESVGTVQGNT